MIKLQHFPPIGHEREREKGRERERGREREKGREREREGERGMRQAS